jgi:hypothetical protein
MATTLYFDVRLETPSGLHEFKPGVLSIGRKQSRPNAILRRRVRVEACEFHWMHINPTGVPFLVGKAQTGGCR